MKKLLPSLLAAMMAFAPLSSALAAQLPVSAGPAFGGDAAIRVDQAFQRADQNFAELYGGLTPLSTPKLENVSSGVGLPAVSSLNATLTGAMARTPLFAYDTLTAPSFWLPCFYITATSTGTEKAFGATLVYDDVQVEDQAGNLTRLTFGGATSGTCPDGGIIKGDGVQLAAPIVATPRSPTLYWLRIHVTSTGGVPLTQGGVNVEHGAALTYTTSGSPTDLAGTTGSFASTGTVWPTSGNMIRPLAVVQSSTIRSFVAGPATSRTVGQNDGYFGVGASLGNLCRSIDLFAPCLNLGLGSDRLDWFLVSNTNRVQLMQLGSDAIVEDTINDVTAGRAASAIQADLLTVRGLFPTSTKVSLITTEPVATLTALATTGATSSGTAITVTVSDTRSLFYGEFVTLAGSSTAGYNGKCQIQGIVSNTSFTCTGNAGTPAATPAVGTITYTTDWQDYWQTANANNSVLTTVNNWKRTVPAGFYRTMELGDAISTGRNSGHWIYGAGMANGGITADGTHCKDYNCYVFIKNTGVINPRVLNYLLRRDLDPAGTANDNAPAFLQKVG